MKRPRLIAPNELADKLISQLKSGQRIKSFEVGQLLAVIKRAHEEFGQRDDNGDLVDVKIPFVLLDVIGAALLERTNWQRAEARKRKGRPKNAPQRAALQRKANTIWAKNSLLTKTRVAQLIARSDDAGKVNTIRRAIRKPKR